MYLLPSKTQQVMSKYVRREIRNLTDIEREAVLDAMGVVYSTPTEIGGCMRVYVRVFSRVRLVAVGASVLVA